MCLLRTAASFPHPDSLTAAGWCQLQHPWRVGTARCCQGWAAKEPGRQLQRVEGRCSAQQNEGAKGTRGSRRVISKRVGHTLSASKEVCTGVGERRDFGVWRKKAAVVGGKR